MFCYLFLLRICKIFWLYTQIFAKSDNVNAFSVLRNAKIHSIDNLRIGHDISNLVKRIEDCF